MLNLVSLQTKHQEFGGNFNNKRHFSCIQNFHKDTHNSPFWVSY